MLQETFKFTIHTDNIGLQGEAYVEKLSSSIAAGEPIGQICALEASWVPAFINAQMMAPLDTLVTLVEKYRYRWPVGCDFTQEKWNKGVMEATTVGGHVYGMSTEHTPGYVIFFNKRLLQEAGYGVDELYDLQRDGKWNWSKFEEVLQACTREAGSDGSGRTWGIAGDYVDYYTTALYASGADPVAKTATGRFANQIDSGKVIKTLTWADEMWKKYSVPEPAETSLDRFKKGEVAMWIGEESVREELDDLKEVLGFVMFPCPDGKELIAVEREVVMFIPSTYDEETAKKIALAYDLLTDPVHCLVDGPDASGLQQAFRLHDLPQNLGQCTLLYDIVPIIVIHGHPPLRRSLLHKYISCVLHRPICSSRSDNASRLYACRGQMYLYGRC